MLSPIELNKAWAKAVRQHALTPLMGERGEYLPIGGRSLSLLDYLWKNPKKTEINLGELILQGKIVKFFGDPHFEHANIIRMCERPYVSIEDMDQKLWNNLENAYNHSDLVVCVGDLSLKNPISYQRKIVNQFGKKHLLLIGNHDVKGAKPQQWADSGALSSLAFSLPKKTIKNWLDELYLEESQILDWDCVPNYINFGVSHWPMPSDRFPGKDWICLHGHTHNRPAKPLCINFSVEGINYQPKTLKEVINPSLIDQLIQRQHNPDAFSHIKNDAGEGYL